MAELPKIISVDDHVLEPPNVWVDRLPSKYHDVGPRIERKIASNLQFNGTTYTYDLDTPDGTPTDFWVYEDLIMPHRRIIAAAGFPVDEVTLTPITYDDMRPGCYEQKGRLEDMDINWVEASLSFPTFPRFCGQTFLEAKDRDLAMLCVRAYNDWMVEEWSAGTDGRLIPLCLIPLWDPAAAAAEVRRNAARGVPAVCFSEIPYHLGLPSIHDHEHWEPFFAACEETDTVVCMHIGSSSKMPATSPDAPASVQATLSFNNAMGSLSDFLYSGVLVRHPGLKLAYSEGQIGWLPYILERADDVWNQFRGLGLPPRAGARAAVDLLLPPGVRLLLPRPPRHPLARRGRGRQHHLRDRLPPLRLDLAQHQGRGRGALRRPRRRGDLQDRPRQRHPHAPPRLRPAMICWGSCGD